MLSQKYEYHANPKDSVVPYARLKDGCKGFIEIVSFYPNNYNNCRN